ncbi:molybdopterin-dependent oxidoreductase [Streptomyces roseochromogenus]|uniref:molybdopterin-dependent oxidoreductase n=1 Tax=Streptomyces roseochromogenus TaxID=285450 RepID=UPI002473F336|nr:molybdopterin-dependent oxidoreductase [Streptomyces roseochromogenus]
MVVPLVRKETRCGTDLRQLRAMPRHEQITQHFRIQGWSGIAKWGGVSMRTIIDLVKPQPGAKWVVFYSLGRRPGQGPAAGSVCGMTAGA